VNRKDRLQKGNRGGELKGLGLSIRKRSGAMGAGLQQYIKKKTCNRRDQGEEALKKRRI